MEFTVQFIDPPKPGKKLGNVKTTAGERIGFDPAKFTFAVGKSYDCTVSESEFQGKMYKRVESQKEIGGTSSNGASGGGDRFWLPFCSNQVAHAFLAGLIKSPDEIKVWALAAKEAITAADSGVAGEPPDF